MRKNPASLSASTTSPVSRRSRSAVAAASRTIPEMARAASGRGSVTGSTDPLGDDGCIASHCRANGRRVYEPLLAGRPDAGMLGLRGKLWVPVMIAALAAAVFVAPAHAQFPYGSGSGYSVPAGTVPNDLSGDGNDWKFAATPEAGSIYTTSAQELFGVRGAHVVDSDPTVATAWQTTVGRPDVT